MMSPWVCGLAYAGGGKDSMFSITGYDCMFGTLSFANGIGSNFGCKSDRGTEKKCSEKGYNYGYRDPGRDFRSIMSQGEVTSPCIGSSGANIPHIAQRFSNPNIPYRKKATGSPTEDNARWIN
jgi:hypothetical protein